MPPWRTFRRLIAGIGALGIVLIAGCEERPPEKEAKAPPPPAPPTVKLERASFSDLPGWSSDTVAEALPALRRSCGKLMSAPAERAVGPDGLAGSVADWKAPCAALTEAGNTDSAALRDILKAHFQPFAVHGADGPEGLFTGYYEATLKGARFPGGEYQYPLYRRPGDLISVDLKDFRADLPPRRLLGRVDDARLVPYYTRAEIADGALSGRNLELLWADDPVDVFFLHVQGSGIVQLPDGDEQRVGFAASNGRAFTAIGRKLIDSGELDGQSMSMQAIRDWLRAHPDKARTLMDANARYIFFRPIDGAGPIGSQGVPLTARRSLAIDPDLLPLGAPIWLATTYPASDKPFQRLMVAQDTGSAIKGAVRGDVFWGHGEPALAQAGKMKQTGRYWILLPRAVAERRKPAT